MNCITIIIIIIISRSNPNSLLLTHHTLPLSFHPSIAIPLFTPYHNNHSLHLLTFVHNTTLYSLSFQQTHIEYTHYTANFLSAFVNAAFTSIGRFLAL